MDLITVFLVPLCSFAIMEDTSFPITSRNLAPVGIFYELNDSPEMVLEVISCIDLLLNLLNSQ